MSVGTWGYGTGATSSTAHPFSLTIQGVDVIDAVPIESITVSQSLSGNATLTFSILDTAGTMAVPGGWSDVVFAEHSSVTGAGAFDVGSFDDDSFDTWSAGGQSTTSEYIFGGLVMGTTIRLDATPSRWIDVRCVDYGILLDVTPTREAVAAGTYRLGVAAQAVAGVAPLGGLTAIEYIGSGPGRLVSGYSWTTRYYATLDDDIATASLVRTGLNAVAEDASTHMVAANAYTPVAVAVWVTPLRQIAVHPMTYTFGAAPLEVRVNPTTAAHVAASDVESNVDHRTLETGVYVRDTDTTEDASALYGGTINGYTVAPGSTDGAIPGGGGVVPPPPLFGSSYVDMYGSLYLADKDATTTGRVVVTSSENFMVGQELTVYYPAAGLDGDFAIHAVSTQFLGGTASLRRSEIQFSGELGTVSRFNRTRFARAGVTT